MIRRFLAGLMIGFLVVGNVTGRALGGDPAPLVKGTQPNQFNLVGLTPDSLTIEGGEVRLSGKPLGYFATRTSYRDFTLTFEYRFDRPADLKSDADFRGNSGLLLFLNGPPRVWPDCVQVQLDQADPGAIFALGGSTIESQSNPIAQKAAVKPVGEWNKVKVISRGGTVVAILNGVEVARGEKATPAQGPIAWQSEGKPVRFRQIQIQTEP